MADESGAHHHRAVHSGAAVIAFMKQEPERWSGVIRSASVKLE